MGRSVFVCLLTLCLCGISNASLITYSSRSAFDDAVRGQKQIDFDDYVFNDPFQIDPVGPIYQVGAVSFGDGGPNSGTLLMVGEATSRGLFNTAGISTSYLLKDGGIDAFVINFDYPIYSLGMDIGLLFGNPLSQLVVSLSNGEQFAVSGLLKLDNSSEPYTFVGFSSQTAITHISLFAPQVGIAIDNFAFSSVMIPEPASFAMWAAVGLVGLLSTSRLRQ